MGGGLGRWGGRSGGSKKGGGTRREFSAGGRSTGGDGPAGARRNRAGSIAATTCANASQGAYGTRVAEAIQNPAKIALYSATKRSTGRTRRGCFRSIGPPGTRRRSRRRRGRRGIGGRTPAGRAPGR